MADRQDVHQRGGLRMGVGQGSGGKTGQKYLIWWRMVAQVGEFTLAVLLSHLTRTVSALLQFELWDYNTSGAAGIGGIRTRGFLNARKYLPPPHCNGAHGGHCSAHGHCVSSSTSRRTNLVSPLFAYLRLMHQIISSRTEG